MARYMTAATKISRVALASPDNRPVMQQYKVEFGTRQDARMGEEMPFATHGGSRSGTPFRSTGTIPSRCA